MVCDVCGTYYSGYSCTNCGCNSCSTPILNCGDPLQLDASSVFYHKTDTSTSKLVNLDVANGTALDLILELIDNQLGQLDFDEFSLTNLRGLGYIIHTLQDFASVVDEEIGALHNVAFPDVVAGVNNWIGNLASDPGAAVDGNYWYNTSSGKAKIKLNSGVVKTFVFE